jgi:hypothetical protein
MSPPTRKSAPKGAHAASDQTSCKNDTSPGRRGWRWRPSDYPRSCYGDDQALYEAVWSVCAIDISEGAFRERGAA